MNTLEVLEANGWRPLLKSVDRVFLEKVKKEMESTGAKCRITGGVA